MKGVLNGFNEGSGVGNKRTGVVAGPSTKENPGGTGIEEGKVLQTGRSRRLWVRLKEGKDGLGKMG